MLFEYEIIPTGDNKENFKLTDLEVKTIVAHGETFEKYLKNIRLGYATQLINGKAKGIEPTIYVSMQAIDNIIKEINKLEKDYQEGNIK